MPRRLILRFPKEFLIFSSAFLLGLSFPKFNLTWLIWIALVPAFQILKSVKSYREAFLIFFAIGFLSYLISFEWLRHVTFFGLLFVCALEALYFGFFGLTGHFFFKKGPFTLDLLALPAIWVVMEWIRTEIPVWGFGWNLLAYSQAGYLPIARFADIFGAYGVSFLIVFFNFSLWLFLDSITNNKNRKKAVWGMIYTVLVLIVVYEHGLLHPKVKKEFPPVAISVIEGNVPQSEKWNASIKKDIIDRYRNLSEFAGANHPDLIIWPEAAWPGVFNFDRETVDFLSFVRKIKIPFLIGGLYEEKFPKGGFRPKIFNTTFLVNPGENVIAHYDKIRLVPFGEFVPFQSFFSLFGLEKFAYSLGVGEFSSGAEYVVFDLPHISGNPRFSTLICFEDIFPTLSREFVKKGAQFLVVVTNDAWFGKSGAPYQHLQASIFRALETGVPIVRAANTGVSGFVSARGEVLDRVKDKLGNDTWVMGGLTYPLPLENYATFYLKAGYFFPLICLILGAGSMVFLTLRRRSSASS